MSDDVDTSEDAPVANHKQWEEMLVQARRLLSALEQQVNLQSNDVNGTCPVFYGDEVFHIALPWASFDNMQMRLASRHAPIDGILFKQLFDLIPTLKGKAIIDIGAYSGLMGLVLRRYMRPEYLHMIEPQGVMQEPLRKSIEADPDGSDIGLSQVIIDDATSQMVRAESRPDRLSEVNYLRREGGNLAATTIDALGIERVGLLNLDIPGQKIYAIRSAAQTIERSRPAILTNLTGRDISEINAHLSALGYEGVRIGGHSMLFLPQ